MLLQLNFRAAPGHNPSVLSPQATEMYWWGNSQSVRENVLFPDRHENATEDPMPQPQAAENSRGSSNYFPCTLTARSCGW